ncbi:MAG: site-specific DNA-methyltransferase [Nitrosomonas sp.]|uniref:site-specific DNA-methyltransferase n=1 Tax=Nitrosomonas sp. TaxID=42353 RepID=UPI0027358198|nr:site-specific DNA-methyltransferase [Nitrosomonas sp.]MDP3281821.1 site-specific DNA-methyltransferase [Nitrosomonas sp.]
MEKLTAQDTEAQSADIKAVNIAQLKTLFPELLTESANGIAINVDVLKQLVGDATATDAEEKYGLNWHGKRRARQIALTPSTGTLRPCRDESVDWNTTQNLMIEGDNLEVLKLLQKSYAGKVKLIYIDPPYNTGKDFVYPDNFQDNIKNYLELTGQVEGGRKISSNSEASGRFHTDWLNMMYPRLKLARNLLREDGVMFVSIDENELDNLLRMGNEIFGEENFVGLIAAQLNPRGRHLDRFLARTHEYLCVFAKDAESNALYSIAKDERMAAEYRKEDDRGKFRELELRNRNPAFNRLTRPNLYYPIYVDPTTGSVSIERSVQYSIEVFPKNSEGGDSCWTWGREKLAAEKSIVSGRQVADGGWRINRKDYLVDENGKSAMTLPKALWIDKSFNNDLGKKAIQELFDKTVFDFPKSPAFVAKTIEIGSESNDLVLDFFGGSGTTGQAVMAQNFADGGKRRYILVQLPEPLDPENKDQKIAADFCNQLGKPLTIAELTKERLRRAAAKIKDDNPILFAGDTGFRAFKLDTSNIRAWNPDRDNLGKTLLDHEEHILPGRTEADIVYELLLKLGLDLCVPIESRTFAGKTVGAIGGGVLLTCLAERITTQEVEALAQGIVAWHKELAPAGDTTCVFRDSAFENDIAKSNLAAILEQYGIANVRSL